LRPHRDVNIDDARELCDMRTPKFSAADLIGVWIAVGVWLTLLVLRSTPRLP